MKTRRSFFYTMITVPFTTWMVNFLIKPPKQMEITPDDLLFHSRPIPDGMIFKWDEEKGRWECRNDK